VVDLRLDRAPWATPKGAALGTTVVWDKPSGGGFVGLYAPDATAISAVWSGPLPATYLRIASIRLREPQ
jgi:hypothetical protein